MIKLQFSSFLTFACIYHDRTGNECDLWPWNLVDLDFRTNKKILIILFLSINSSICFFWINSEPWEKIQVSSACFRNFLPRTEHWASPTPTSFPNNGSMSSPIPCARHMAAINLWYMCRQAFYWVIISHSSLLRTPEETRLVESTWSRDNVRGRAWCFQNAVDGSGRKTPPLQQRQVQVG